MKKLEAHSLKRFKRGLIILVPIGILIYLAYFIYNVIVFPVNNWTHTSFTGLLFIVLCPYFTGWFLEIRIVRDGLKYLTDKHSRFSFLKYFLLEDSESEGITDKFPEVEIPVADGFHLYGYVTKKWISKVDGAVWCHVVLAHCPIIFTGNLAKIKESKLIYTGRLLKDIALTHLSFGIK